MTSVKLIFGAALACVSLTACNAPTPTDIEASLKSATATVIPGSDATKITISNQQLEKAKWVWQAGYDGKVYACDADDQMRLPSCSVQS